MPLKLVSEDKQRVENISELQNDIKPTEDRVVFVESVDADGSSTFFYWNSDGNASDANGDTVIESLVSGYSEGEAKEGTWEQGSLPVDRGNTDQLEEGSENLYFEGSRARNAVDPDIYESATRIYVDGETGTDPAIDYDPANYDVLPGRNEGRAFETIGRAVEEVRQNIRPEPSNSVEHVTNTPEPISIFVASGSYVVDNPISLPKRVGLQGDGLRTTLVEPENPKADLFHVQSRNFVQLFRYKNLQHPSFVFSFPSVVVETDNIGGSLDAATIEHSPYGYECDYNEVFSEIYPTIETGNAPADLPSAVQPNQLISAEDPNSDTIEIYQTVADGQGGFEWTLFASTEDPNNLITSDGIIEPLKPEVKVSDPRGEDVDPGKTRAQASITIDNGRVDSITIDDPGSGYVYNPMVSIAAPVRKQPYIIGSPYLYNSSAITGPFTTRDPNTGERKKIPETMPLPYDEDAPGTDPISGETINRPVDQDGSGGGTKIDGRVVFGANKLSQNNPAYNQLPNSPLKSMVAAQFTQVNQGGPGHLLMNDAFGQYVSCFTTFSNYSYRCQSGGFALLSNSVSDFGNEGLIAEGKLDEPYTTGTVTDTDESFVKKIEVPEGGENYDPSDTIDIDPPQNGGTQAQATLTVSGGAIESVSVDDQGSGYTSEPSFTINSSTHGSGDLDAELDLDMDRVITVEIKDLDETENGNQTLEKKPIQGTAIEVGGEVRDIAGWTERGESVDAEYGVTFVPGVLSVEQGQEVKMYQSSRINSSGHAFEFPGSGTTYNALPEYGGVTDASQEKIEAGAGSVFLTSSNQRGDFRVGDSFKVNQTTGTVTLETDKFSLAGLQAIGPFKVSGENVGVQLKEVTNRTDLTPNAAPEGNTVPTVRAINAALPDKIFNEIDGRLDGGANINIVRTPSETFVFDFQGVKIEDADSGGTTVKNSARTIEFANNLSVTNENDANGDPTRVVVDSDIEDTDDVPEGNDVYFTESRVYSANKGQFQTGSDIAIVEDDGNETLEFQYDGEVGAKLLIQEGKPSASTGSNGELYIDSQVTSRGGELDRTKIREVVQEILQTPDNYISSDIDYKNDVIEITINKNEVQNDL